MTSSLPVSSDPALLLRQRRQEEALRVRAGLMAQLQQHIAAQGWSDEDVMRHFNLDRNRMHYWKKGPKHFSMDGLMVIFVRLGLRPALSSTFEATA